jgi:polypeptide N-acetylgalactosaminyltransferase
LGKPLEDYMSSYPKVKILRAEKREGLISARIRGAVLAKGPVLTFLDSHVECTTGWLEPLLDRIAENPTNVVCPVIDVINDSTFEFQFQKSAKSVQIGGFSWRLKFRWNLTPEREHKRRKNEFEPIRSPTMAGRFEK